MIRQYGNAVILPCLLLEYLGLPAPGETLMTFLGALDRSPLSLLYSLFFSVTGTFVGSMLAYAVGLRFGEDVVLRLGKPFHLTKEKLGKAKAMLERHETAVLLTNRFIPGVRHVMPYLTGITRFKKSKTIFNNLISSLLWCTTFIGLGALLGAKWNVIVPLIRTYSLTVLIILIYIFIVYKFLNRHKAAIYAFSASLLIFIRFCYELIKEDLQPFDSTIYRWITHLITEDMTDFMIFISSLGSLWVLAIFATVFMLITWKHRRLSFYGKMAAVNLAVVSALNVIFKMIFRRPRPDLLRLADATGFSFPSGHSMIGLAFYGFIVYFAFAYVRKPWNRWIAVLLSVLTLMIGISRIYLGVHYASDVIAGFAAGLAWLAVFIPLVNRLNAGREAKKTLPEEE